MTSLIRKFKESRRKATAERKRKIKEFAERQAVEAGKLAGDPVRLARAGAGASKKLAKGGRKIARATRTAARRTPGTRRRFKSVFEPSPRKGRRRGIFDF